MEICVHASELVDQLTQARTGLGARHVDVTPHHLVGIFLGQGLHHLVLASGQTDAPALLDQLLGHVETYTRRGAHYHYFLHAES